MLSSAYWFGLFAEVGHRPSRADGASYTCWNISHACVAIVQPCSRVCMYSVLCDSSALQLYERRVERREEGSLCKSLDDALVNAVFY